MSQLSILQSNYGKCMVGDVMVDGEVIFQHKLFHGDWVQDDYLLQSSQRSNFLIGGVLKLKNTYTFEKGDLFEFVPINWRFPKFLVRSNIKNNLLKKKKKVTNYFVVIKFKEWTDKIPRGMIVHSLGPVEEIHNQYEVLFYYYPTMTISPCKPININPTIILSCDTNIHTFTIDPRGCEDMDDALSYDPLHHRVGIHITDLTVWVDTFVPDQYFTVYAPHKNVHMFPLEISTQLASLKEGQQKHVITCWVDIKNGQHTFEVHPIYVTKNLTYEDAETLVRSGHPTMSVLWEQSQKIGDRLGIQVTDTHKMIEVYMIYYNQAMANHLRDREEGKKKTIYRSHQLYKRAFYTLEPHPHEQLKLPYYTHATSPIRRYADFLIQQLFKRGDVSNLDNIEIEKMNAYETSLKRLYRMWDYSKASHHVEKGKIYKVTLQEVEEERLLFSCDELEIRISMKIPFTRIEDCIMIYEKKYRMQEDYWLPIYVIEDTKHTMFHKILIEFPKN